MPTILTTSTSFSGLIRNEVQSINSVKSIVINADIKTAKNKFEFNEVIFSGQENTINTVPAISTASTNNSIGIVEQISLVNFYGSFTRPEKIVLNQDLDITVADSQDYITVVETVEIEGPYWS